MIFFTADTHFGHANIIRMCARPYSDIEEMNEAFIAAFDDIEKEIIESWKSTPARDAEGRERLWTYLTLLKKVRTQLETTLETGKLAQLELSHRQSAMDKLKDLAGF